MATSPLAALPYPTLPSPRHTELIRRRDESRWVIRSQLGITAILGIAPFAALGLSGSGPFVVLGVALGLLVASSLRFLGLEHRLALSRFGVEARDLGLLAVAWGGFVSTALILMTLAAGLWTSGWSVATGLVYPLVAGAVGLGLTVFITSQALSVLNLLARRARVLAYEASLRDYAHLRKLSSRPPAAPAVRADVAA